jgi:hypothetical protein
MAVILEQEGLLGSYLEVAGKDINLSMIKQLI